MTDESKRVMYIGPTIRGVVKHGTVFSAGISQKLIAIAEKKPVINNLIVPLAKAVNAKKESQTEGTARAVAYYQVLALSDMEIKNMTEGE